MTTLWDITRNRWHQLIKLPHRLWHKLISIRSQKRSSWFQRWCKASESEGLWFLQDRPARSVHLKSTCLQWFHWHWGNVYCVMCSFPLQRNITALTESLVVDLRLGRIWSASWKTFLKWTLCALVFSKDSPMVPGIWTYASRVLSTLRAYTQCLGERLVMWPRIYWLSR